MKYRHNIQYVRIFGMLSSKYFPFQIQNSLRNVHWWQHLVSVQIKSTTGKGFDIRIEQSSLESVGCEFKHMFSVKHTELYWVGVQYSSWRVLGVIWKIIEQVMRTSSMYVITSADNVKQTLGVYITGVQYEMQTWECWSVISYRKLCLTTDHLTGCLADMMSIQHITW